MEIDPLKQSVTCWIEDLKTGRETAAQQVWDRYFERLVRHAQRRLGSAPRRIADEEDVALSAFDAARPSGPPASSHHVWK